MSGETLANDIGENQEKVLDPRVESLAIPLARDYAEKNYPKLEDGTFEPAWRGVNGEKDLKNKSPEDLMAEGYSELAAHESVIDIANQPYNEYSEYWKEQNRGGAEFLIGLMDERGADTLSGLDLEDEKTRAEYGDLIHENWISRNEWVKDPNYGDPKLACSFAELSAEEQQKDIDQLGVLQKWIAEQKDTSANSDNDHETISGKLKTYEQNREQYEKARERYEKIFWKLIDERDNETNKTLQDEIQKKVERASCVKTSAAIQYISNQGEVLIGDNTDLKKEWVEECERLEWATIDKGKSSIGVFVMGDVLHGMALMEKGGSNEELCEYIKKVSDGRPYVELTMARFMSHFGSNGQNLANAVGINDLSQDVRDFYNTKSDGKGGLRGIGEMTK